MKTLSRYKKGSKLQVHCEIYKEKLYVLNRTLRRTREKYFSRVSVESVIVSFATIFSDKVLGIKHVCIAVSWTPRADTFFFPTEIKPLLKKGSLDITILNNYWPISNLPFLGEVLEKSCLPTAYSLPSSKQCYDIFRSDGSPRVNPGTTVVQFMLFLGQLICSLPKLCRSLRSVTHCE